MTRIAWRRLVVAVLAGFAPAAPGRADDGAASKALAYLAAEVPAWSAEHKCFSCHNNGDAARALYRAVGLGRKVAPEATAATDAWLGGVARWEAEGGKGPVGDRRLARVQFAAALASAVEAGRVEDRGALGLAAEVLVADQAADGSWGGDDQGVVGSPATHGRPLATWLAAGALRAAGDPTKYRGPIDRANAWLNGVEPANVPAASVLLLALGVEGDPGSKAKALDLLAQAQGSDGGWGPFRASAPEAFDTALALLALDRRRGEAGVLDRIARGRAYLVASQSEDGSWAETTRPGGRESYAQRVSTTAWATLALLAVGDGPG